MHNLNFTLEVIHGSIAILTYFLLIFLAFYLIAEAHRKHLTWKDFFIVCTSVSLVVSVFIEKIGNFLTNATVWLWRVGGGSLPFSEVQDWLLATGASFTAIGLLMLVRVLSYPRFGNWPWVTAALITLSYIVGAIIFHNFM